ncbi:tyrosine-type recombinase/integrase [Lysinibacillus fusiformis]|uniref:tyrosine-type recombinase/integrase n=1 Tax=Lysinibacillus fusiformis TaxID=28031 RepID=UPI001CD9FF15|nr:tyrosine-type recombinase/integrase [Lysinibacillus fusiformis]
MSERGTRLGIRQMQKNEEQVGIDAEIKRYLHPHRFRHTFATEFLTKGADLFFISDELTSSEIGSKDLVLLKLHTPLS